MKRNTVFAALLGLLLPLSLWAVPVDINSGDPAFPFPQFLPYVHPNDTLHNLGTRNPAGVVHAEMEKTIRDAYQIMMNRAQYEEGGVGGKRYIQFVRDGDAVSEGAGYAMLAAAMMADKTTFDGLWLYMHDFAMNNVIRHSDGTTAPEYSYSTLPDWQNKAGNSNSAADGDVDIALGLMIAHMQWGEFMGINDSRGNPISYKNDLIQVLKGLTDTLLYNKNNVNLVSGDIGLDGYMKNGDSWPELTEWSRDAANLAKIGVFRPAETAGPGPFYFDYSAPAYFNQFRKYLNKENANLYAWNIRQFERAEASCDWLMGRLYAQNEKYIPYCGNVTFQNDTTPVFKGTADEGEDFRASWRTILNYMWNGNSTMTWDPANHSVLNNKPNSFQRDMALRYARFLWDNRQPPWNNDCRKPGTEPSLFWGPAMLVNNYTLDGTATGAFYLNWIHGVGSPSAVSSGNFDLMAEMYRHCEIEWDVSDIGDLYLTSKPKYFHGFFRLLGMMVLTGNHHAPLNMVRSANMKVYLDVDKTYAFENDTITYTIDYRNFGALDAQDVLISNRLHSDFVFVSSTGDGVYDPASHTVRWNLGTVPGFRTLSGIEPTKGQVQLKVIIPSANHKRYQNRVEISCSNGTGWVSNEYANRNTPVMKRNGVDIARRALIVNHSVFRDTVNPGMSAVFTIDFENSSEAGWLNGGTPGVNFSYSHKGTKEKDTEHIFMVKSTNDAHQPYVDYGNYRISYFLYDQGRTGLAPPEGTSGWVIQPHIIEGLERDRIKLLHENIPAGEDSRGKWNQRLVIQFADPTDPSRPDTNWATMGTISPFLETYYGSAGGRVHRGINHPIRCVWAIVANGYVESEWGDDWSFNPGAVGEQDEKAFPITPDFYNPDPNNPGTPVTTWHRKMCMQAPYTVNNVLIEEWDGYTWRRVLGDGPLPGREVVNVVIRDTIPAGLTFEKFIGKAPFGIEPVCDGRVITWSIPRLLVGEKGTIKYSVIADTPSVETNVKLTSRAWVSSDKESAIADPAVLVITRNPLSALPPEPTTMYKSADKPAYKAGDTVHYQIAYRQTHGLLVKGAPSSEWTGGSLFDNEGNIAFNVQNGQMVHKYSYGKNFTLGGTFHNQPYGDFYLVARQSGSDQVDILVRQEYADLRVSFFSNGVQIGPTQQLSYAGFPEPFDYKIVFQEDSLKMWVGDTATMFPSIVQDGIPVRSGYAGVRCGNDLGASISGWSGHFDLAYDVAIRDTIPWGMRYLSSQGQIVTGDKAGTALTAQVENGVITWPVVFGETALGADDSLFVVWTGIVDTSRNGVLINTAYTDLRSYPLDSIGAQAKSKFGSDTIPDDPDDPLGTLRLHADPAGCIFTESIGVSLTASVPGASIWFTTNGVTPDSTSIIARRYTGSALQFFTATNLKAIAYAEGFEPSDIVVEEYEPLQTVPVEMALFYDNNGDGLADGLIIRLQHNRTVEPNMEAIIKHLSLLTISGNPDIDTVWLTGDSLYLKFTRSIDTLPEKATLKIQEPILPGAEFMSVHGYLGENELSIFDAIAPVILEAVYRPSIYLENTMGERWDTLEILFNEYANPVGGETDLVPFIVKGSNGTYTFLVDFLRRNYNRVYFIVKDIQGENPVSLPSTGDSIRIIPGQISDLYLNVQNDPNNRAVPLQLKFPELNITFSLGPNPFRSNEQIRMRISVEPFLTWAFEDLKPSIRIYDCLGNKVIGETPLQSTDGRYYEFFWNGYSERGRKVGTGTYVAIITVESQAGKKNYKRNVRFIQN